MDYIRKENEFSIYPYCLEKDIDFEREKKRLTRLCYKHGLCYDMSYRQIKWELPTEKKKKKLIKSNYRSTYIFTLKKKIVESFFQFINLIQCFPLENRKNKKYLL